MKNELCALALGVGLGFAAKLYIDNKSQIDTCVKKMIKDNEKNIKDLKNNIEL